MASVSSTGQASSAAAWELLREHTFDRVLSDAELERLIRERARTSQAPHADIVRVLFGMRLDEAEARAMLDRVLTHRRAMERALRRPVHVRVAALDLLTSKPQRRARESQPLMVAPDLLEQALEEAGSDTVTGLPRAARFTSLLEYALAQRNRRVIVAYIDLDHFKAVNDRFGHAAGDAVLRAFAEASRSVLRRGDVLARLGGDEFGLMIVNAGPDEASAAIDRLRTRFEASTSTYGTSFSSGIAVADAASTARDLVERADAAMYEEKRRRATMGR
jgi:diguanylate cyclase (GGDEF)-like protein